MARLYFLIVKKGIFDAFFAWINIYIAGDFVYLVEFCSKQIKLNLGEFIMKFNFKLSSIFVFLFKKKWLIGSVCVLAIVAGIVVHFSKHTPQPALQPPYLQVNDPKYTNNNTMIISGRTSPGAGVLVGSTEVHVQKDGSFSVTLGSSAVNSSILRVVASAPDGLENVDELDIIPPNISARDVSLNLYANAANNKTAPGGTGGTSSGSGGGSGSSSMIIHNGIPQLGPPVDTSPLDLTVSAPAAVYDPQVIIGGTSKIGANITINNQTAQVGINKKFAFTFFLTKPGPNQFNVTATDAAGHVKKQTVSVIWDNQQPNLTVSAINSSGQLIKISASTPYSTNLSSITLQGTASDYTPVTLKINNVAVPVGSNGSYTYKCSNLKVGDNFLNLTAVNAVGYATTLNIDILRN